MNPSELAVAGGLPAQAPLVEVVTGARVGLAEYSYRDCCTKTCLQRPCGIKRREAFHAQLAWNDTA